MVSTLFPCAASPVWDLPKGGWPGLASEAHAGRPSGRFHAIAGNKSVRGKSKVQRRFAPMVFTFGTEWCSPPSGILFRFAGVPIPDALAGQGLWGSRLDCPSTHLPFDTERPLSFP